MSEFVVAILGLLLSFMTFFIGQYTERQKSKMEQAQKIVEDLGDFLISVENSASKHVLRYSYTSLYQDIQLFCKKYGVHFERSALPLLTDLLLYTTGDPVKLEEANSAGRNLNRLILGSR